MIHHSRYDGDHVEQKAIFTLPDSCVFVKLPYD